MNHCLTEVPTSVVESIFVKRVAVILMCNHVNAEEKINAIKNEYALMCGMGDDEDEEKNND